MANITFEEFKNEVMENIKSYLPEAYQDYMMEFQMVRKAGCEYEALMISPTDRKVNVTPALNITAAYEKYQDGMAMNSVLQMLADIRTNASLPNFSEEDIFSYDNVKDRIYPRLINTAANTEYLKDKFHKDIEDLSIVYTIRIREDHTGIAEAVITNDLARMYGIDCEQIHNKALANLTTRTPFFKNMEEVLFSKGYLDSDNDIEIEDIELNKYNAPFFILSNQQKIKGAAMVLNSKLMDKITAKLGDFYIIPSSIHEVIIAPKEVINDVQDLVDMVRSANSDVEPEDRLSDNVYEYDMDSHSIKVAT